MIWTLLLSVCIAASESDAAGPFAVIVKGADGTAEYGETFSNAVQLWKQACEKGNVPCLVIGQEPESDDLAKLEKVTSEQASIPGGELWLVFIGHGTYDGRNARFNLRGPDVQAEQLAQWLAGCQRPVVIVNCSSCSGPFLNKLAGPDRVVITATKSGHEQNYTHFNKMFAEALTDLSADFDKDGQISLLECYLAASRRVADYYEQLGRLATEHSLLDDNGDGLGTPADWFQGVHPVKRAKEGATLDGRRAHQLALVRSAREQAIPSPLRERRNELELQIFALRDRKSEMAESDYFAQLEKLMIDFATLCQEIDTAVGDNH